MSSSGNVAINVFPGIIPLITIILYVGFFAFAAYLMITVIIFLKRKTKNDMELIKRLDELIELHKQKSDH